MGHQIRDTQLPPRRLDQTRRALTLVELLVVIAIIGILATLFLGAMYGVMESAKVMKTRAMIVKLNNLIMPRYESYRTRRVPIQITQGTPANVAARYRLDALHELMRMEMPDRMTDIIDPPITLSFPPVNPQPSPPAGGFITRPALSQAYYKALAAITAPNPPVAGSNINATNQGAECLYMIITLAFVDELGRRDLFNESNVGDTDQDGLPEFLDGWGTPIAFLRWTPGFTESEINGAGGLVAAGSNPGLIVASGASAGAGSYGLARRNNAYAGRQVTFLTIGPSSVQSATIISSTYDPVTGLTYLNVSGSNLSPVPALGDSFGIDADPFDPTGAYPSAKRRFHRHLRCSYRPLCGLSVDLFGRARQDLRRAVGFQFDDAFSLRPHDMAAEHRLPEQHQ